jgi:hypothetical protein
MSVRSSKKAPAVRAQEHRTVQAVPAIRFAKSGGPFDAFKGDDGTPIIEMFYLSKLNAEGNPSWTVASGGSFAESNSGYLREEKTRELVDMIKSDGGLEGWSISAAGGLAQHGGLVQYPKSAEANHTKVMSLTQGGPVVISNKIKLSDDTGIEIAFFVNPADDTNPARIYYGKYKPAEVQNAKDAKDSETLAMLKGMSAGAYLPH